MTETAHLRRDEAASPMRASFWLLACGLAVLLTLACSGKKSRDVDDLNVVDLTSVPHFKLTQETTFSYLQVPTETIRTVVLFQAPDSWKETSTGAIESEAIMIGDRAWKLQRGQWLETNPAPVRATRLAFVKAFALLVKDEGAKYSGKGPAIEGESTVMLVLEGVSYGENLRSSLDNADVPPEIRDSTKEIYRDVQVRIEITVGERSHRLYRAKVVFQGPNVKDMQTFSFDYSTPVIINPPR